MCATYEPPPRPIETFVFMDLEATGLPPSRPKIAEMCLFSVNRHALENPQYSNSFPKPTPLFPHLVDKLCIYINPDKPFTPTASSITGLNNEVFANNKKQSFNLHVFHMITAFFSRQHPPICLVAHNGYGYDFPLLKAELSALGISALDEIYCADTIKAMKALDRENNQLHQFLYQPSPIGSKKKYGLRDLYFKFFKVYPLNSHSAEGDVITLISIFQQRARDLMCWMDLNARQFNTIKNMYKENVRYASFSKTPMNIQPVPPSLLQDQPRRRITTVHPAILYPVDNGIDPTDNEYTPLYHRISELPDEIKNTLLLFIGLIVIVWIALKTPV
ncbi:three prime repair exonuclease 2-like [Hemicordylus capensis]|uniref:three prime repair exonuclease 2-like n=1 Tax=Hemicordylus capensis TaxID=884348 RepID=UPI00230339EB|nr:three prime repair exonuclease 2-like [Hemicordylus capensis]XP_053153775.1 three prime repair exonuclease 2-like [Hemicordylus capensis]XP_053153776.1 three prime repair exonuclease 2-like [Hemicordylus capensis]XP_053153777.1 three prime repair exonuclease 2-like [Hemicordylus capensis]XP_053153778.1 three prime repair exonuclease 2-like [Hemicordylus capensis]